MNFSNVFFEQVGVSNQNTRLNAFQFAAKIHEVSISLSLSAMVLNYVQYELLNGRGVPLGSLLAPFQVNNLGSLWSPGVWATGYASGMKRRRFLLLAIIVLSVLLASIVGPASAILMAPSLSYWDTKSPLPDPGQYWTKEFRTPLRFYIMASESTL